MESTRERAPGGLAHIGGGGNEPLLHSAVGGNACQYATATLLGRVDDQARVGRDAGTLVERALRQHLHLARREILDADREAPAVSTHDGIIRNLGMAVGSWKEVEPAHRKAVASLGKPAGKAPVKKKPTLLLPLKTQRKTLN